LAEALFRRAPERIGEALARAIGLAEGEPAAAALERLDEPERVYARAAVEAFDELHRQVAAWLDAHMLLPVLHLGQARSLAGRIDAVTSNRAKRRETLERGWFGRLGEPASDDGDPRAELDEQHGYLAWRSLRLGELQLADASHLADDQPAGHALEQLADELRKLERD
jgi:hypothetical protein